MPSKLLLALLAIAFLPLASAGTATDPEINDAKGDGGTETLDILSVWIDPSDTSYLTFRATFAAAPPQAPQVQDTTASTEACPQASTCVFASLSYVFTFRVLDPEGNATPQFPDYSSTYVTFRAGPKAEKIAAPIGYRDTRGLFTFDGAAEADLNGTQLTLRVPRSSAFVNLPRGAAPGAYQVDQFMVYSLPELCFPQQDVPTQGVYSCAPLAKPIPPTTTTPPSTTAHWDNAPDSGFARVFTFPSPAPRSTTTQAPAPTTVTQTRTQTVTQTFTYTQTGQDYTYTQTVAPQGGVSTTTTPPGTTAPSSSASQGPTAKKSPGPELALVLAGVAVLLAVRRRLSA